jgi:CRP/FNR family transcriptional regulator, cyclic AMP receptor protein
MPAPAAALLAKVPLFEDLSDRELAMIAASMKARTFPAGHEIAREGQHGVGFFVIESGDVQVLVGGQPVGRLGPGDHFGEIALIADGERTATIRAQSELHCYGMTSWDFRPLVEDHADIAWKLLQAVARKIRDAERR